MSDDLDALLTPEPGSLARRAEVLAASTRIVRRRSIVRRCVSTFGIVCIFALGGVAGWLLKPNAIVKEIVTETVAVPLPMPESPPRSAPTELSPHDLEQRAELSDDQAEVARLYREAGDKYLNEARDYEQAARCYRLHLNAASIAGQRVTAEDSWLLMFMKNVLHKENRHATPGS